MRRASAHGFDPSVLFNLLNIMDRSLVEALSLVTYLDDDQLVELFRACRSLGPSSDPPRSSAAKRV